MELDHRPKVGSSLSAPGDEFRSHRQGLQISLCSITESGFFEHAENHPRCLSSCLRVTLEWLVVAGCLGCCKSCSRGLQPWANSRVPWLVGVLLSWYVLCVTRESGFEIELVNGKWRPIVEHSGYW